tara:strand:+ start:75 stop:1370 length:1296 start_codon:yes stop_codon:yes gene_type:complete
MNKKFFIMIYKFNFLKIVQYLFYLFPFSLILGSMIVNINMILFLIFGFIYVVKNKIKIIFDLKNLLLLAFFLTIILSSLINVELIGEINFFKSILLIKFFLIFVLIECLLIEDKLKINVFFKICLIFVIIVSLDIILQFFIGKNIFGFEPWEGRITGLFGSEAIAGGYIQKFFIFSLISIFTIKFLKSYYKDFFQVSIILILLLASSLASNRMSFVIVFALIIFLISFYKIIRKKILIAFLIFLPIFLLIFKNNTELKLLYSHFYENVNIITNKTFEKISSDKKDNLDYSNKSHLKIFSTSFKSFSEKKIIGNGLKSLRYKCIDFVQKDDGVCSSHSHNYHLEVLHDTGIVGFVFISLFVLILLISKYKNLSSSNISYLNKFIISLICLNFLIEIFPIKSSGSLFSTWTGTILWISVALTTYNGDLKNKNE